MIKLQNIGCDHLFSTLRILIKQKIGRLIQLEVMAFHFSGEILGCYAYDFENTLTTNKQTLDGTKIKITDSCDSEKNDPTLTEPHKSIMGIIWRPFIILLVVLGRTSEKIESN